jgi:hypothetical protein
VAELVKRLPTDLKVKNLERWLKTTNYTSLLCVFDISVIIQLNVLCSALTLEGLRNFHSWIVSQLNHIVTIQQRIINSHELTQ